MNGNIPRWPEKFYEVHFFRHKLRGRDQEKIDYYFYCIKLLTSLRPSSQSFLPFGIGE